jgi:carboxyl-terminal processing protease
MKKHTALVMVIALAFSNAAGAQKFIGTPAQDLFDQASFFMEFNYNGFSNVNLPNLIAKYQAQVDSNCASRATDCPFSNAERPIALMVRELQDPHSYFVPSEIAVQFAGQLGGTGLGSPSLELATTQLPRSTNRVVTDVREDGPAGKAGLKRGDQITSINGQGLPIFPSLNDELLLSLEAQGQPMRFGITREGKTNLEISITPILVGSAWLPELKKPIGLPNNTALIRIHEFTPFKEVGIKFHELVNKAQTSGATSIVVDLRDNPGGTATECTSAPGAFLPEISNILETRYARTIYQYQNGRVSVGNGKKQTEVYNIANPAQFKGQVAVLVNADSASCAEVFAAQMQYAKRGVVIGENTFGVLNTATRLFDLANGSFMGLTIGKGIRPDGTYASERVNPDTRFNEDLENLAIGRDAMLEKALEALNIKPSTILSKPKLPRAFVALGGI